MIRIINEDMNSMDNKVKNSIEKLQLIKHTLNQSEIFLKNYKDYGDHDSEVNDIINMIDKIAKIADTALGSDFNIK